ncbi:AAA family ATPase, partial [Mycobacterium avium subsp. hominissuis]
MSTLHIPEIADDTDNLTAALAYAKAGSYVGPVKRGTKHPGSVLGKGWHTKTSRAPQVVAAMFAGTDHGIFLHCGRSGAVVLDVDHPDEFPGELRRHLITAPYQSTRPGETRRGHYLFAAPPGRLLGNGTGKLGGSWGEIRGQNGVIVVAPSVHPSPEGEYRWQRTGAVPKLPNEIADLLPEGADAADAATDEAVAAFLDQYVGADRPDVLNGLKAAFRKNIEAGQSCHISAISAVAGAMKEARSGLYAARLAVRELKPMFMNYAALGGSSGRKRTGAAAESEWVGILAWGVGQAIRADPGATRARVAEKMSEGSATIDAPTPDEQPEVPVADGMRLWRATDLQPATQPRWLARNRIPSAAVSLLIGDEGIGKSLLWVWIIYYVTTGKACPEFGIPARKPGNVILVVTEDDWQTTVLPRLEVAGVDLAMVSVICAERDGSGAPVFPRDLPLIRNADPAPALVAVDAWLDTVPSQLSVRDPQQARQALHPWKEVATTTGAAVLLLCHTNRVATANARDKYGATGELRKKARMTLFAQTDDDGHLVVGPEKANTAAPIPASKFTITGRQYFPPTEDHDGTVPLLVHVGDSTQTAREHIETNFAASHGDGRGESDDAVAWLAAYLAAGPRWSTQLHDAREAAGIGVKKLRTAKTRLRVESRRIADGPWFMSLPEHKDRDPDDLLPFTGASETSGTSSQVNPDVPQMPLGATASTLDAPSSCEDVQRTNGEA